MAAKFEFEVMVSPSSARSLFQRALRLMPQEKKLWLEVGANRLASHIAETPSS
jgi:hypothetical protein